MDTNHALFVQLIVTKIEWRNPHAWLEVSVTGDNGQVSTERIEVAGPNSLIQAGIDSNLLQIGQVISVEAWPTRDAQTSNAFAGRTVILGDGRRLDVHDRWGEQFPLRR